MEGGRNGKLLFDGYRVSVLQDEKVLEIFLLLLFWRFLYNKVNIINTTELYTLNTVKMVIFMLFYSV